MRTLKITLIFLFLSNLCAAQVYRNRGLKIGLVYEFGQPVHRIGGSLGFHANLGIFQFSMQNTLFHAFRNYGPKKARIESQSGVNLGIGFGPESTNFENLAMLSPLSNYSLRTHMVSYGVKLYSDKIGTDQLTGIISLRFGDYFFATENDAFVFQPYDKFRTGAFSLGRYFFSSSQFTNAFAQQRVSADIVLYTGQTQNAPTERINEDRNYPARFGYKKLNKSLYSDASHGIFRFSWQSNIGFQQRAFASIGIDNEKIRNLIQNKFIHDLPFLPRKLIKIKNPHVPMRNAKGDDYLYRDKETIRKGKFVWGLGLNRPLFY